MGFLKRWFGAAEPSERDPDIEESPATSAADLDEEERRYQAELMAGEAARLDDFLRRQERYADRSWVPPAQGTGHSAGGVSDEADEA